MSKDSDFLVDVMRRLRQPEGGCPWDLEQDHVSLARYTLEEAYEVVEAIEAKDAPHLCEELGDLLLQIVFHAQISAENGGFTFDDVARLEAEKMIERHPHVFGDRDAATAGDVLKNWEADKAQKRAAKAKEEAREPSVLEGVNTALPALPRALKLQQRAARVGFDWENPIEIVGKIHEELAELEAEIPPLCGIKPSSDNPGLGKTLGTEAAEDELGDLLFVVINLARRLNIDPERALRRTNAKFERRFRHIETALAAKGEDIHRASLAAMEELWNEAKKMEKAG